MAEPKTQPATVDRDALVRWLDAYLEAHAGKDYGPNGLQVQGAPEIRKLVTGVSACHELFVRARELGADAVLVHHGIFWDWQSPVLTGMHYHRVAELLRGDLNLLAYHLPLDRHPEVGNNALACDALGLESLEPFGEAGGLPVGFQGRFPGGLPAAELVERCRRFYGREPLHFSGAPDVVETVGVISGGAQKELPSAIGAGLDAFITGEVSEWVMNTARESGVHFLSCGHYATEVCGVRVLGERIAERFGVEVEFVDVPNPV
ncbi:MAG: Nif3-like dinuclear metal center hexameric protein [Thermoanaerobaculia bacterium]